MAKKDNNYITAELEPIKKFVKPKFIVGKKYYLYAHTRHDNGEVFYFGIGSMDRGRGYYRANCHKKRNPIWKRIVAKTGYTILIIDESDNKQDIINKEIQYIQLMGKKRDGSGTLSNITNGGEGLSGFKVNWTPEMRQAASFRLKNRIIKESTREKLRNLIKGRSFFGKKNNTRPVYQTDINANDILREFESIAEASRFFKVKNQSISNALKNNKQSCGFKWKYKDGK